MTKPNRKALIVGIANERSIAWAIAKRFSESGYDLILTFQNEATEKRVRPLAESIGCKNVFPLDVTKDESIQGLFENIKDLGKLDALIHSVAFANREDLEGRFVDTSRAGFHLALDVSAFSLVALSKMAEPLLKEGGSILTLTYYGAEKVVKNYNIMGVAKAALEASVRYLANDLGSQKIRVNAISAGPIKTLAAAGIRGFKTMLSQNETLAPLGENIDANDVAALAQFLASDDAKRITGEVIHLDSGTHILAAMRDN